MINLEPAGGDAISDPIDRLIVQLRGYVHTKPKSAWTSGRKWNSGIAVVFDTETTTDPSQRLRFGAYQIRELGFLIERGVFYTDDLPPGDLDILRATVSAERPTSSGETIRFLSRSEFVEQVFFAWGFDVGGMIVGFNLPFDLSRIATDHTHAKGSMTGGFSFTLGKDRPNVRVKHLSQRAAFIDTAGKNGFEKVKDRGLFLDVKTLAATLTSQSHTLASLAKLLGTTPKSEVDTFDGPLTPELVRYGMNDVQVTWECFDKLKAQYERFKLGADLTSLYSEASLGKAFLAEMGIAPWRSVQPKFPPEIIGQIMSAYYGGRAEVHIRREITPVIHCDFRSMYPTVCTLMGLWKFVIAKGIDWSDATDEVRAIVDTWGLPELQDPKNWLKLTCLVQVRPDRDIFPVRAVYEQDQSATIGLNYLSSDEPMWFTLADVLASKLLGGKSPEVVAALRFTAQAPQDKLRTITLEGTQVRPAEDDFYKLLIDQRGRVQAQERAAKAADKPALTAAQQSLKILANSTSYGIFVELNVQTLDAPRRVDLYDFRGQARKVTARKLEDPGRYFHPMVGTLITGAARLMLALAERNAIDQGLDWAFCDTDSLAIANTHGLPTADFADRVERVREWFTPLNPYEKPGSILQLEKVNFPPGQDGVMDALEPVQCLAISAKRYVLFNRDRTGAAVIRKASAHGLGQLISPYPDPDRRERIGRIGVELWQEDLWREIIRAYDLGQPDVVDYGALTNFDQPAASRYAATNQTLLKWFKDYNASVPPREQVWPFNFLLSLQAKSKMEMVAVDPDALNLPVWTRRLPHPASRFSSDLVNDQPPAFDRQTGEPIPWHWLKSTARSLVRHHLHSEMKFNGGADDARGTLTRRHVRAWATIAIGKEADNLEERETLGDDGDAIEWAMANPDLARLMKETRATIEKCGFSDAEVARQTGISHHTASALRRGLLRISPQSLLNAARGVQLMLSAHDIEANAKANWHAVLCDLLQEAGGRNRLAKLLNLSPTYVGRLIKKEREINKNIAQRISNALSIASMTDKNL